MLTSGILQCNVETGKGLTCVGQGTALPTPPSERIFISSYQKTVSILHIILLKFMSAWSGETEILKSVLQAGVHFFKYKPIHKSSV